MLGFFLLLGVYEWCFGRFFPNATGKLGHDYSYTLPELLAGDYWFHTNGWSAVPWFTPAFCGGKPFFADPQSMYYSLAQWLSFVVDPLSAIHGSLLIFATAGFWGTWLLARRTLETSPPAAFLAATVFMFNGFYATRMVVGHYTFHSLMLLTLLAWLLLGERRAAPAAAGQAGPWTYDARDARAAVAAGLILAYMVNSGLGSLLVMAGLAFVLLALAASLAGRPGNRAGLAYRLSLALGLGLAISAAHLVASFSLLGHFPRSDYLLPGYASLLDSAGIAFEALFLAPTDIAAESAAVLRNVQWVLGRHELEYGVTLVPLLALAILAWRRLTGFAPIRPAPVAGAPLMWLLLALVLLLPIAFNTYDADWNALLKSVPLVGASSTMVRWFALYIPLLAVLSAFGVDALPEAVRVRAGVLGALLVVVLTTVQDRTAYDQEPYPPKRILAGASLLQSQGTVPAIRSIGIYRKRTGEVQAPLWRNDALVEGSSQMLCYYPTFGYNLEHLPFRDLQAGPVDTVLGGDHFNLKNPACYVYPAENACEPGAHFRLDQKHAAADFVNYRDWSFSPSNLQRVANAASEAALLSALLALLAPMLSWRRVPVRTRR